jgi:hypothetical protein
MLLHKPGIVSVSVDDYTRVWIVAKSDCYLGPVRLSVGLSACISTFQTGLISVKFGIGGLYEKMCEENRIVVKTGQQYPALYVKT